MGSSTKHLVILLIALVLTALTLCLATNQLAPLVKANPYRELGSVPPDANTKPSIIVVLSPLNESVYIKAPVTLTVNVSVPQSSTALGTILYTVVYKGDWQQNETYLYINSGYENSIESQMPDSDRHYFSGSLNLTDVPDGNHSIIVTATAGGFYDAHSSDYPSFYRFID
jgi:hypothetical protein